MLTSLNRKSPYLASTSRLGDVIAAIQAMSIYQRDSQDISGWAHSICGKQGNDEHWKNVFSSHPEFFALENNTVSLVWRRNNDCTYDIENKRKLSSDEILGLSDTLREGRLSRAPLTSDEISTLINTAINLHSRAIEHSKEKNRMFVPLIGLLGVVLGAYIKGM